MDDNQNQPQMQEAENQQETGTIFSSEQQTSEQPSQQADPLQQPLEAQQPQTTKPEEVAPEVQSPEGITGGPPPDYFSDLPPVYEQNTNKWIFIIGGLVFFLIIFGLFYFFFLKDRLGGSGGGTSSKNEAVTISWWGLWEGKEVYDSVIQDYQSKNSNVTINYEKVSQDQYRERLIARSKTGNGPDIFTFHNTWLPEMGEVATPLPQEIMSNETFNNTFYPIHQKDLSIDGNYYGIPFTVDGLILIYNEELLNQAGIVSPPTTWVGNQDDVLTIASKLTVKDASGKLVTAGLAIGTAENVEHFSELYGVLLLLNGGNLDNLNDSSAKEALELYRSFAEKGLWDADMPNSISAFTQGRVAMIIAPSWEVLVIKSQNPDLVVKTAPLPKGLNDNRISLASYWVEGVNKYSPHQLEAWKFLAFVSQKEELQKIYDAQSQTRLFGSAFSRVDMADLLTNNQYLESVVTQAGNDEYVSFPVVGRTFDNGLNDEIVTYLKNAINQTINGVDYANALSTAQSGIQQTKQKFTPTAETPSPAAQ
ncbi:extracellular solute-binding protein [Candidatus Woesebacteria bacterium]|nr:extracellular solute-binding protein [Candidatus Woesebacteria bacterium]